MKTTDVKRAFAALAASALSFSAFAGVSFTWTGAAGNNLYSDNGNWSISGQTTHKGPDWTDDAYVKTDDIGHDVTIIMDTPDSHPNIFQTTGSHKVTINTKDESYQLSAYYLYLEAADHEFNIKVYQYAVRARNFPITRSATFNRDVSLNDSLTINNRSTSGDVMNAIHFYGTLKMKAGCVLGLCRAPWTDYGEVHFHGPLICDELRFGLG